MSLERRVNSHYSCDQFLYEINAFLLMKSLVIFFDKLIQACFPKLIKHYETFLEMSLLAAFDLTHRISYKIIDPLYFVYHAKVVNVFDKGKKFGIIFDELFGTDVFFFVQNILQQY